MRKYKLVIGSFFFCLLLLGLSAPVLSKTAEDTKSQVIRVGFMNTENFLQINSNGHARGYGADYLEKISEYTGWKYEYVYGSLNECLKMLESGKIDMLMPISYSKERSSTFLYSEEMCYMNYAFLVGNKDNNTLFYEDVSSFDDMEVGMVIGNDLNNLFRKYEEKYGFDTRTIYYATEAKMNKGLENGDIDSAVNGSLNFSANQKILAKIDYEPGYFIMTKENQNLMNTLDEAQYEITLNTPTYKADLYKKYYSQTERQTIDFTKEEYEYIKTAPPIKVVYETDDFPLEHRDTVDGKAKGLYVDILRNIFDECGLSYELIPCETGKNAWEEVSSGKADVLLSAYDTEENQTKYNLAFTEGYFTAAYNLVGKRRSTLNLEDSLRVAVISRNEGEKSLIRKEYPNWELIECTSLSDCLKFVDEGDADIALVNSLSLQIYLGNSPNNNLVLFTSSNLSMPISLGISSEADTKLKSILNKGIQKLDTEAIQQSMFNNILTVQPSFSLTYYIHTYPVQSVVIVTTVFLLVSFICFFYFISLKNHKQNLVLQAKNKELEDAIALQGKLQQESEQDPLTGLKNKKASRLLCINILNHLDSHQCALIIVDIDDFKYVNDTFGHLSGDEAIKQVAELLGNVFSKGVAGRIGGDEFLVMSPPVSDVTQLKEEYLDYFCQCLKNITIEGHPITCSIGAALTRNGENSYREMFARADNALYAAKRNGKNQYAVEE